MSVARLLVEGELDAEVVHSILEGRPVVEAALCAKNALPPRTRVERQRTRANVCYLRDRDFDSEPPADQSQPTVDLAEGGTPLGWRWCRHELESYLLEPALVTAATGWNAGDYAAALIGAGQTIVHYQTARWTVGAARMRLPPYYDLHTRPDEVRSHEIRLPADVTEGASITWVREHAAAYRARVDSVLGEEAIEESIRTWRTRLQEAIRQVPEPRSILVWCSAKDLLAALDGWLRGQGQPNAGAFRARMRDWVRNHAAEALEIFPEWRSLVTTLRS